MNVGLNVPDHTTLSRRSSTLKTRLKRIGKPRGRVDLVIDSTGLMIHGEGRWTRHKHGKRKRRGWRKLHIGVSNGFIVAHYLSEDRKTDGEIAPHLIKQVGKIDSITADKAYDQSRVYEAANDQLKEGVKSIFIQEQMQLFPLQMKQHLDSEISTSNQSMKTVC